MNVGDLDVTLLPESAPQTVENFMNYVNKGAYNGTIFHRSVPGFVIQGGGFKVEGDRIVSIPADAPVQNEFNVSNTRGTVAMAKLEGNPNSATNQWFFNLSNSNAANLDAQNGGFTVFGRVANAAGLALMDRIGALPRYNNEYPLYNYRSGPVLPEHLVTVHSIRVLPQNVPAITSGGVITPSAFSGAPEGAVGSYIEIYGTNLAATTREWNPESDFKDGVAPTTLDDVTVTVGGRPAYVSFVSPTQVNAQVPEGVAAGDAVPVVVSYQSADSAAVSIAIRTQAGRLLAPASFKVGDNQYVAALHANDFSFVSNGTIPNVPAAPARPGEVLVLYGVGFGPVTPGGAQVAGRIAQGATQLANPVQFRIGGNEAATQYAGLAPNFVGLYQFNVVVPTNTPAGDLPLEMVVNGTPIQQPLLLSVRPAN